MFYSISLMFNIRTNRLISHKMSQLNYRSSLTRRCTNTIRLTAMTQSRGGEGGRMGEGTFEKVGFGRTNYMGEFTTSFGPWMRFLWTLLLLWWKLVAKKR